MLHRHTGCNTIRPANIFSGPWCPHNLEEQHAVYDNFILRMYINSKFHLWDKLYNGKYVSRVAHAQ